jgi:hypothetical protein
MGQRAVYRHCECSEAIAEAGNPKQPLRGLAIASYLPMTVRGRLNCTRVHPLSYPTQNNSVPFTFRPGWDGLSGVGIVVLPTFRPGWDGPYCVAGRFLPTLGVASSLRRVKGKLPGLL